MERFASYNFQALQDSFEQMSQEEIMEEYEYVSNLLEDLLEHDLTTVQRYCEPIDNARDFLGHYLAKSLCHAFGYFS